MGVPPPGMPLAVSLPPPPGVPVGVPVPGAVGVPEPGVPGMLEGGVVGSDGPVCVSTTFVVIVVEQVTVLPPPFSEPLHWSTVTGNEALVVPAAVHTRVPPPPLPEPLHCDTDGEPCVLEMHAVTSAPPPWPDPLHWLAVNAVAGAGAFALMLLTMSTVQTVALPPALSELLHWCTALMTSLELDVSPVQPFRVHVRR